MLLESAKSRYLELFRGLPPDERLQSQITNEITWAMQVLRRQDRVVWYLRWYRLRVEFGLAQSNKDNPQIMQGWKQRLRGFEQKSRIGVFRIMMTIGLEWNRTRQDAAHFGSLMEQIPQLQRVVWDWQSPQQLFGELKPIEQAWIDEQGEDDQWIDMSAPTSTEDDGEYDREPEREPERLIEFPDGFVWFNLNRPYCDQEGEAMGHCGNAAARDGTVLSLRYKSIRKTPNGQVEMWRPVCTFILHQYGNLGEMKGRGNRKPAARYHPYIVALLKSEYVSELQGGGHASEENFALSDLPPPVQNELIALKPGLPGLEYWWRESQQDIHDQRVLYAMKENLRNISPSLARLINSKGKEYSISTMTVNEGKDREQVVLSELISVDEISQTSNVASLRDLTELMNSLRLPETLDQHEWAEVIRGLTPAGLKWLTKRGKTRDERLLAKRIQAQLIPDLFREIEANFPDREKIQQRVIEYGKIFLNHRYLCPNSEIHHDGNEFYLLISPKNLIEVVQKLRHAVSNQNGEDHYREYLNALSEMINYGWWDAETDWDSNTIIWDRISETELKDRGLVRKRTRAGRTTYVDAVYGEYGGTWLSLYQGILNAPPWWRRTRMDQIDVNAPPTQPNLRGGSVLGDPDHKYTESMDRLRELAGIR